jgi:hypothetical protein
MDPNYQGVPYSYSQPVTEADVMPWALENPQAVPTISDLLSPASNPGTNTVPISPQVTPTTDPGSNPNPNPTPGTSTGNVTNTVRIDWGESPDWVLPTFDAPGDIMGSIMQLLAPIQRFAVPSHNAECPRPSINLFERMIVMDGHCALLDAVKPTLYAVMTAVWAIVAAIIVLTA